jgi:hypothetical protein
MIAAKNGKMTFCQKHNGVVPQKHAQINEMLHSLIKGYGGVLTHG